MKKYMTLFMKKILKKRGYSEYYAKKTVSYIYKDLFQNKNTTIKEKIWAYKRGFLSSKIRTYGLTEDNYKFYLSDFDYYKLHPLNNTYTKWIDDKLTTRYILSPFKEHLIKHYLHINNNKDIIPLSDIDQFEYIDVEGIMKLLDKEKKLAFKPESGSGGKGFYKLLLEDGKYLINDEVVEKDDIVNFISSLKNYLITEYVVGHNSLRKINDKSLNTIRIMVVKEGSLSWIIPNAFIRFGTSKTGTVDNITAGGIFALIDVDTGMYSDAKTLKEDGSVQNYEIHPDSKVKIEGYIPNWEFVKNKVIEMCKYMSELNYLGFDVAITEDGFKVIEINSHQNIRAFQVYSPLLKDNRATEYFKSALSFKCK